MNEIARAMLRLRCFEAVKIFGKTQEGGEKIVPFGYLDCQEKADDLFEWCIKEKAEK